jgi:hypothetical protein
MLPLHSSYIILPVVYLLTHVSTSVCIALAIPSRYTSRIGFGRLLLRKVFYRKTFRISISLTILFLIIWFILR